MKPDEHYDRVTPVWEYIMGRDLHYGYFKHSTLNLEAATKALTMVLAEAAQIYHGMTVLDIGCGTGLVAALLATTFDCQVIGISPSSTCVSISTDNARSLNLSDVLTFEKRDGMNNGFPDATFDRVWIMESSHLMDDLDALVSESSRVVKPGGRIALCDLITYREFLLPEVLSNAKSFILLERIFGRAKIRTMDAYRSSLLRSGFAIDIERDVRIETKPTFAAWRKNVDGNRDKIDLLIGSEYADEFLKCCDVLEEFWEKHIFGYGIIAGGKRSMKS